MTKPAHPPHHPTAKSALALLAMTSALLLAGCAAPAAPDGVQTVRKATTMNAEVRVASFARWDEQCRQVGLPDAAISARPAHGTLSVRQAVLTAGGHLYNGSTNCRDKLIPGVELWYAPKEGFRGTDRMAYQIDAGQGPVRFAATVDVR